MSARSSSRRCDPGGSSTSSAYLAEAFHSWQGEGLHVGRRQLFLRFAECNLRCAYCDTTEAYERKAEFTFEGRDGKKARAANPVTATEMLSLIETHGEDVGCCREVALTGGEPLLWWRFLREFLPRLRRTGRRTALETNGTLPEALLSVIDDVDVIAMDVKLASTAGQASPEEEAKRFLATALAAEVFVKVVVGPKTTGEEMEWVAGIVRSVDARIPVVVQPVTGKDGRPEAPPRKVDALARGLLGRVRDVRVIGQVHKFLGMR
ncbi:MAG: 7-carboxy-7-deazaguanine synthase QueE [Planctomycetota bacterium]